jgi:hypothetical protein
VNISTRVNLFFETLKDIEIDKLINNYKIIRLKCGIQFKTKKGWTKPYSCIIDTGAHTSVIPLSIWKKLVYKTTGDYKMYGLSKKEECSVPVSIGKITCIIVDETANQSKELSIFAFLAKTDQVPVIIGFKDILEKFKLVSNFNESIAYMEE